MELMKHDVLPIVEAAVAQDHEIVGSSLPDSPGVHTPLLSRSGRRPPALNAIWTLPIPAGAPRASTTAGGPTPT